MKRLWTVLTAALILAGILAFAGCSEGATTAFDLHFKNSLEDRVDNMYITAPDNESWGDPITSNVIDKGHTIGFDFRKFDGTSGNTYDIGLIDQNGMDYDFYEVVLTTGDTIEAVGNADAAKITVTHADGTKSEYDAIIYAEEGT
jgi:hypothetical protein